MSIRSSPTERWEQRSWRAVALTFFGFGGLGLLLALGAPAFGVSDATVTPWLRGFSDSPLGLAAAIIAFAALAFVGAPQFMLIAAAVAAFGPWRGGLYSWAGAMVSAAIGFGLGRAFAGQLLNSHGAPSVQRFVRMVGRNGFGASLIVRLVPTAPFALINMAAGATRMSPIAFLAGTGVGVAPKIVVICLGAGAFTRYRGAASAAVWLGAAAVLAWILLGLTARLWARRWDISRQP